MSLIEIQNSIEFVDNNRVVVTDLQMRVVSVSNRVSKTNSPYSVFKLADSTAEVTAIMWWNQHPWTCIQIPHGSICNFSGEIVRDAGGYLFHISEAPIVDPQAIRPETLLPYPWLATVARDRITQFLWLLSNISHPMLQGLIIDVLLNPVIALGFASGQGSQLYHHNWAGGLFQHSVEVATKAFRASANLSKEEQELTIVVGLLHDIGKAVTINGSYRTELGKVQPHDMTALEILAQPLRRLDRGAPHLANQIREFYKPQNWYPRTKSAAIQLVIENDNERAALCTTNKTGADSTGLGRFSLGGLAQDGWSNWRATN